MFSIIDTASGASKKTTYRACDQCKQRKVRCDGKRPCTACFQRDFQCSYDQARKKRGPVGKRIQAIQRLQDGHSEYRLRSGDNDDASPSSPTAEHATAGGDTVCLQSTTSNASAFDVSHTVDSAAMQWHSDATLHQVASLNSPMQPPIPTPMRSLTAGSLLSDGAFGTADNGTIASPSMSEFIFPGLPIESPSGPWDPFGSLLEQEVALPTPSVDIWPSSIDETRLMPWYDVYFKRLHPTIPILSRAALYHDLLLRKHHTNQQYGAMVLGLCAFAMSQPVQIHERTSMPSRSSQARMLMDECVKLRVASDFGEEPSIEMVLTSFFLFACLFGSGSHKAARMKLREAVDLAYSMGIHSPQSYSQLGTEAREQWLRTYLVLSVTERAYALQQRYSIDFRGRPGMTARFMQSFDSEIDAGPISEALFRDSSDSLGMIGLLYLMETFDAIDESVIDCWNGFCPLSDGVCETFDRRRALAMFRAQHKARESCITGNLWLPSVSPRPLSELKETQRADIHVTQLWLLNRLWNLCFSHNLLRVSSDRRELRYTYAYEIGQAMLEACDKLSLASMEVHGVGLAEKIFDIGTSILTALKGANDNAATTAVDITDFDWGLSNNTMTVEELLLKFQRLLQDFRGGDHPYNDAFTSAMHATLSNGH